MIVTLLKPKAIMMLQVIFIGLVVSFHGMTKLLVSRCCLLKKLEVLLTSMPSDHNAKLSLTLNNLLKEDPIFNNGVL